DRDDLEQEIVLKLIKTVEKYGDKPKSYLKVVARHRFYRYLRERYDERSRLAYFGVGKKGSTAEGLGETLDARMDASATLAIMPERLKQIGFKILDGEKLSKGDRNYWAKQKGRLRPMINCRSFANRLTGREKRRILRLHGEGIPTCKIARTMGRGRTTVMRVLASRQISRQSWLTKMELATKERDERIRHAYFVDGKTVSQIEREFHHSQKTVRKVIRSGAAGTV
ncbi:unnamed protein product, partial [marine sediment metagenome]